jgi:hypothetical protein
MILQRIILQTASMTSSKKLSNNSDDKILSRQDDSNQNALLSSFLFTTTADDLHCSSGSATTSGSLPQSQILACSATLIRQEHLDLFSPRKLCQDRKGWIEHLYPDRFTMNVCSWICCTEPNNSG